MLEQVADSGLIVEIVQAVELEIVQIEQVVDSDLILVLELVAGSGLILAIELAAGSGLILVLEQAAGSGLILVLELVAGSGLIAQIGLAADSEICRHSNTISTELFIYVKTSHLFFLQKQRMNCCFPW